MRISDWSSDVCSSDLEGLVPAGLWRVDDPPIAGRGGIEIERAEARYAKRLMIPLAENRANCGQRLVGRGGGQFHHRPDVVRLGSRDAHAFGAARSEEHTSELQSLMRISYAVFCLKKKKHNTNNIRTTIKTNNTHPY